MAIKLAPPYIEGKLPAFTGNILTVPFSMSRAVGYNEISGFKLKLKTVYSGIYLLSDISSTGYDIDDNTAVFEINGDVLNVGQFYKIQIAYIEKATGQTGHFSTVGVAKYTKKPTVSISNLDKERINTHIHDYIGNFETSAEDPTEKEYSYCFNLYKNGVLYRSSGELIHNNSYSNDDRWELKEDLNRDSSYSIEYKVKTVNSLEITSPLYKIAQKRTIPPTAKVSVLAANDEENGYISVSLEGKKDRYGDEEPIDGKFRILRSEDGVTWREVYDFSVYGVAPSSWSWKDYSVAHGKHYRYALQQYNDNIASERLESPEIMADFEYAYLQDKERVLKIKYNTKVSSFKDTILESKTNTIGSKYPFFFRNGTVQYKEFPISGLISYWMDLEQNFMPLDREYLETDLTGENIADERDFKLAVMEWLENGKPKLFRSPQEGNYVVRLTGVSLSPDEMVGRMLHTFTATASEMAPSDYDSLAAMDLIKTGEVATIKRVLKWATVDVSGAKSKVNLLPRKALALIFDDFKKNDEVQISNAKIWQSDFNGEAMGRVSWQPNETGHYEYPLALGHEISTVMFANDLPEGEQRTGLITYAYYDELGDSFSDIEDIEFIDYPCFQVRGEPRDIFEEIEKVTEQNYQGKTYENRNKEISVDNVYLLHCYRDGKQASVTINDNYLNLDEIDDYLIKNPPELKSITWEGDAVIELSLRVQVIIYKEGKGGN